MHTRKFMVVIVLVLVNACGTFEVGIETAPYSNGLTASVSPIETTIPTVTLASAISECPINPEQASILVQLHIDVKPSQRDGWCEVSLPLNSYKTIGYGLRYPAGWVITLAGAEGMNLRFDTSASSEKNQGVFVQLAMTDLPLEQADKATYGFEMAGPDPLVGADESQISRAVQTIGDKQVLVLITSKSDQSIKRYFTLHSGTLYMFEIKTPPANFGEGEIAELSVQVEEMISSLRFMR